MGDLISREDLIDWLTSRIIMLKGIYGDLGGAVSGVREMVKVMPSVESERTAMVWKPAKGRPAYEKGICSCGYVLSVLQRDFVYCPNCGARLEWSE